MLHQLISDEKFTNVQKAQAGLTKLFRQASHSSSFFRVLRNDEPLGVLVPNKLWDDLIEDLETLSAKALRRRVAGSRRDNKRILAKNIEEEYGL